MPVDMCISARGGAFIGVHLFMRTIQVWWVGYDSGSRYCFISLVVVAIIIFLPVFVSGLILLESFFTAGFYSSC